MTRTLIEDALETIAALQARLEKAEAERDRLKARFEQVRGSLRAVVNGWGALPKGVRHFPGTPLHRALVEALQVLTTDALDAMEPEALVQPTGTAKPKGG